MIGVVIPYFQREPGILRRALASIATQRGGALPLHVVVVDDASPVPAAPEVAALGTLPFAVQVITQRNGGPGAARNTGLDALPAASRYVAFLDSDDEWSADHLQRAEIALDAGHDLYFADHFQLGQSVGAFARAGRIVPSQHPPIAGADDLHAYQGDMLDQIIRGNVIGTSTVVYRREPFAALRFRVEFTNAGEDYLFWMELARRGARVCFSGTVEATYGKGVNIFSGVHWGSEQHLLRLHNEIKFRKTVQREFDLTPQQANQVHHGIGDLRHAFAAGLLHRLTHLKSTSPGLLMRHLQLDPQSFVRLPATAWSLLAGRK